MRALPLPLHRSEFRARMKRDVDQRTIYAALQTKPEVFRAFGSGYYGLQDRTYEPDPETESWLISRLQNGPMELEELCASAPADICGAQIPHNVVVSSQLELVRWVRGARARLRSAVTDR